MNPTPLTIITYNRELAVLFVEYLREEAAALKTPTTWSFKWAMIEGPKKDGISYVFAVMDTPNRYDKEYQRSVTQEMAKVYAKALSSAESIALRFDVGGKWFLVHDDGATVKFTVGKCPEK